MDYYTYYKFFLNYVPRDIAWCITLYEFAKCVDCNDAYHSEFSECKCNLLRCKQHTFLKTIIIHEKFYCNNCVSHEKPVSIKRLIVRCIMCNARATNGFKDIICYCDRHSTLKNVLTYISCCEIGSCININVTNRLLCNEHDEITKNDYCNNLISILHIDGEMCSFCHKTYFNTFTCRCSVYCNYCATINTWEVY